MQCSRLSPSVGAVSGALGESGLHFAAAVLLRRQTTGGEDREFIAQPKTNSAAKGVFRAMFDFGEQRSVRAKHQVKRAAAVGVEVVAGADCGRRIVAR